VEVKPPLSADKKAAQHLTRRPKGQRGQEYDAVREDEGSIKPECFPEQSWQGESYTA